MDAALGHEASQSLAPGIPQSIAPESDKIPTASPSNPAKAPLRRSARPKPPAGIFARRRSTSPGDGNPSGRRSTRGGNRFPKGSGSQGKDGRGSKFKLKVGEKSGLGINIDRELDSDDEDLVFEENFILRMPAGADCDSLRRMVASRDIDDTVWFKFTDSRRAQFHVGENVYSAKLVDLPTIIESQKTLDNRQMFKVADICQMLVVEDPNPTEETSNVYGDATTVPSKSFDVNDFIWPHGITPPLKHVRQRRFRKRVHRTTIETVEKEVERLLAEDGMAEQSTYTFEDSQSDGSELGYGDHFRSTSGPDNQDDNRSMTGDATGGLEEDGNDDFDALFAAEINKVEDDETREAEDEDGDEARLEGNEHDDHIHLFEDEDDDEDDDDDEEDDDEDVDDPDDGDSGDDEDEDEETAQTRRKLNEDIRVLEAVVERKKADIASTSNLLIKKRFGEALQKMQADLDSKILQRQQMNEQRDAEAQSRLGQSRDGHVDSTSRRSRSPRTKELALQMATDAAADADEGSEEDEDGDDNDEEGLQDADEAKDDEESGDDGSRLEDRMSIDPED